jgi:hypothetical protein
MQFKSAGCLLVLVTENSVRNENVKREVELALANSVPILPLLKNRKIPGRPSIVPFAGGSDCVPAMLGQTSGLMVNEKSVQPTTMSPQA